MEKILVSRCLYGGEIVRYDGGDTTETDPRFLKWKEEGRLVPVCPEVFGGLPTPRPDSQRIDAIHVQAQTGQDVTSEYTKGAKEALRRAKEEQVARKAGFKVFGEEDMDEAADYLERLEKRG